MSDIDGVKGDDGKRTDELAEALRWLEEHDPLRYEELRDAILEAASRVKTSHETS